MKPRFSLGKGSAPRHVVDIHQRGRLTSIDLHDENGAKASVECSDHAEFQSSIEGLIAERVPFAVGAMCSGASEALLHWFREGGVVPPYLEISWRGPDDWIVREIVDGAIEWQEVPLGVLLANNAL
jgi:hypothetical protein